MKTPLGDKEPLKKELLELFKERTFTRDVEKYKRIAELVEMFMEDPQFRKKFKEDLREHLNSYGSKEDIRNLLKGFDRVILYSNMPHSVVKVVAEVLEEMGGRSVDALGYSPKFPQPYREMKERLSHLLPHDKNAVVLHVTDDDEPLELDKEGYAGYHYIKNVDAPHKLLAIKTYVDS